MNDRDELAIGVGVLLLAVAIWWWKRGPSTAAAASTAASTAGSQSTSGTVQTPSGLTSPSTVTPITVSNVTSAETGGVVEVGSARTKSLF